MMVLVDSDIVAYRVAATVPESDPFELCIERIDNLMQQIISATQADHFHAVLSGKGNFRKKINPEYKANRKDTVPPFYLQDCRKYIIESWNAEVTEGVEADDLLSICQNSETILASLDKDMLQVTGFHYNWIKKEQQFVTQEQGLCFFYRQLLIGDRADNLIGVSGIGHKRAEKLITKNMSETDMFNVVIALYDHDYRRMFINMMCMWLMREKDETWLHRQLKTDSLAKSSEAQKMIAGILQDTKILTAMETCGLAVKC